MTTAGQRQSNANPSDPSYIQYSRIEAKKEKKSPNLFNRKEKESQVLVDYSG